MAHFAKLDDSNVVLEVNAVNNSDLDPSNEEASGIAFLTAWSGGHSNWRQTSYSGAFRKHFAGIGFTYDADLNAFIHPKPYPSWSLDAETCTWLPPVPRPLDDNSYFWDEQSLSWKTAPSA